MKNNLLITLGLFIISMLLLVGCNNEKTTVTEMQKSKVIKKVAEHKIIKIETHAAKALPARKIL